MENSKTFQYNGNNITFLSGNGNTMVNATEMAKPFKKRPVDYLRLPSTNELTNAIVRKSRICENQLVITKQGSPDNGGGTWMHEDLAIDFAQWLNIDFKLWCNDRLKELFRYGFTATDTVLEELIKNPQAGIKIFTALKEEREKHKTAIHRERDMSASWLNIACNQIRELNEAYETAQMYEIMARRYFSLTQGYRKLAIENNIRIPAKLKMTKYNHEVDLKRLRNGK